MGFALYKAAKSRGADVQLVAANLQPDLTVGQVNVSTTEELRESLNNHVAGTDVLIMAAAVSDYRVENPSAAKLKKADLGSTPVLNLVENPDLLAEIGAKRASGRPITLVGFAAETLAGDDLVASARKKLEAKKVDLVVANDVTGGAVFGSDATAIKLVSENEELSFAGSKLEAANAIIDWIVTARK
jgi:phosphopantothenoylcysteine decarboxylase/phosphopantothenate--cysteine ligase